MDKPKQTEQPDITKQRYKGPSALAAGLGEGFLQGKALLFSGIVIGAAAGAIFPSRVGAAIKSSREVLLKWEQSPNHLVKGIGGLSQWFLGAGEGLVHWIQKLGPIEKGIEKINKSENRARRLATAIDGGVITSAGLSFLGFFTGMFTGTSASSVGKKQFEHAKEEIITLRDTNDLLREKLIQSQSDLEDARTAQAARKGSLKVAGDEQPAFEKPGTKVNETQLDQTLSLADTAHARA